MAFECGGIASPSARDHATMPCFESESWIRRLLSLFLRQLTCCNLVKGPLESVRRAVRPHIAEGTMRFRAALLLGAFLAAVTSSAAFGQGFQGGLRGSVKESGGVIPGVEVP